MIYRGHVENGLVKLDDSVVLPEGAQVTIAIEEHLQAQVPTASIRAFFGRVSSGDSNSADNDRIDADLARSYGAMD